MYRPLGVLASRARQMPFEVGLCPFRAHSEQECSLRRSVVARVPARARFPGPSTSDGSGTRPPLVDAGTLRPLSSDCRRWTPRAEITLTDTKLPLASAPDRQLSGLASSPSRCFPLHRPTVRTENPEPPGRVVPVAAHHARRRQALPRCPGSWRSAGGTHLCLSETAALGPAKELPRKPAAVESR